MAWHDLDEAAALEQAESLADRPAAHVIELGEFLFLETAARHQLAGHDAMAEVVGDLLRQCQRANRPCRRRLELVHAIPPGAHYCRRITCRGISFARLNTVNKKQSADDGGVRRIGIEPRYLGRAPLQHPPRVDRALVGDLARAGVRRLVERQQAWMRVLEPPGGSLKACSRRASAGRQASSPPPAGFRSSQTSAPSHGRSGAAITRSRT